MTTPTMAERDAEIAALQRDRDIAALEATQALKSALNAGKVATIEDDIKAVMAQLSVQSVAYQQASNIVTVIGNTRRLLDNELARIEALVPDAPAP